MILCSHIPCDPQLTKRINVFGSLGMLQIFNFFPFMFFCHGIDLFAIWRKRLTRVQLILTAFATAGIQENPPPPLLACVLVVSHYKLEKFSIYLQFSRYLFSLVSVFSGLFSHFVILSPFVSMGLESLENFEIKCVKF